MGSGDDHFQILRRFAGQVQNIQPLAIGELGFGQNHTVAILAKQSARLPQRSQACGVIAIPSDSYAGYPNAGV